MTLLLGATLGVVGIVIAIAGLIAGAVVSARQGYLGLAGVLLLGVALVVALSFLLAEARPDF